MLELDVLPGVGLRNDLIEILLGMPVCLLVNCLQRLAQVIPAVELLYDNKDPARGDVIVALIDDGLRLIFDGLTQRLKVIEVCDFSRLVLKYADEVFSSPAVEPSVDRIDRTFGATHPGTFDSSQKMYTLNFRGLSFLFSPSSDIRKQYVHGLSSLEFRAGETLLAENLLIHTGTTPAVSVVPPCPPSCLYGNVALDTASVERSAKRTQSLHLTILMQSLNSLADRTLACRSKSVEITFNHSCDDIVALLGAPSRRFVKCDDRMRIHLPSAEASADRVIVPRPSSDFFLNYFSLGIDFLIDGESLKMKKFILHTNFPGHFNFGIYHRCQFSFNVNCPRKACPGTELSGLSTWSDVSAALSAPSCPGCAKPNRKGSSGSADAAPFASPVVLKRGTSPDAGQTGEGNPFGSTLCYGQQDMVFEVMTNDHLASLTFYNLDAVKCG